MDSKSAEMGGSNNSSDFVRKLYKMLEDPSYDSIVRWGENGDSFVVLENEKFTKTILPKHFKHSNFASFVRQLNKYDFHKVRQNNEDSAPSAYGAGAWEFKHPEFKANNKDSLDNIRRKAPAPRKATQNLDDGYPAQQQQMDLVNTQLMATQQQLQQLQDRYQDLASGHILLLQQVVQLQKHVKNHENVMHTVMNFLHSVDAQRRNSRIGGFGGAGDAGTSQIEDDHPASPLQQATKLLDEASAQELSIKTLEQQVENFQNMNDYSTPPHDPGNPPMQASGGAGAVHMGYNVGNDLDSLVYPVGHNNGIDPINSEHINNIPYSLPPSGMLPVDTMPEMIPDANSGRKKSVVESSWGPQKPRILLVEDDKVCARIGTKFLQAFECGVDTARDGLEAVTKINSHAPFDLILMDIIMPNLDGVSATVCIREQRPNIPIIAMTSNIRADDIDMYFRFGMNDVLPKPFTKDGMLRALEKHLPSFKKSAQQTGFAPPMQLNQSAGYATPNTTQPPLNLNIGQLSAAPSIKDETSPGRSPATATSWQSPSQLSGQQISNQQLPVQSPLGNPPTNYMQHPLAQQPMGAPSQYNMAPTHPSQQQQQQPPQQQHQLPHPHSSYQQGPLTPGLGGPRGQSHRRVLSDITGGVPMDESAEKRQRMFAPSGYQQ